MLAKEVDIYFTIKSIEIEFDLKIEQSLSRGNLLKPPQDK